MFRCTLPLALLLCGYVNSELSVNYTIHDDTTAAVYIGNILNDSNISTTFDVHVRPRLRVSFLADKPETRLFRLVAETGELMTSELVDREQWCLGKLQCLFILTVAVRPLSSFQVITVNLLVLDRNDHSPVFPASQMLVSVSESTRPGLLFPVPVASDADSPEYSIQRYQLLTHTDTFSLQTTSDTSVGVDDIQLMLKVDLDREKQDFYQLRIAAYDGGDPPLSGEVTIDVIVQDMNDNNPIFESDVYKVEIPENQLPTSALLRAKAIDSDLGPNGYIFYSMSSEFDHIFRVDNTTGDLFLTEPLDYEQQSVYSLTVTARDQGPDSFPTSVKVIVHVTDINDNKPVVVVNSFTADGAVSIVENSPMGTPLAHVIVTDRDSGDNGRVSCTLDGSTFALVQLYESDYKIVAARKVDRERRASYSLALRCHDNGFPIHIVTVTIDVIVIDVNDHAPQFSRARYASVITSRNSGTFVTRVIARDHDSGENAKITYQLDNELFEISTTGDITLTNRFLKTGLNFYEFQVTASDNGTVPRTDIASVSVVVSADIQVEHSSSFDISENKPPGTKVGTAYVDTARHLADNSSLYFTIMQNAANEVEPFAIDRFTGTISTTKSLDRESVDIYRIYMKVLSELIPGWSVTVPVVIRVTDQNDNAPVIHFPSSTNNTLHVSADKPKGTTIAIVIADDVDIGINAATHFFLSGGDEFNEFFITPDTGEIVINSDLRQSKRDSVRLVIVVRDRGEPQLYSVADLHVFINKTLLQTSPPRPSDSKTLRTNVSTIIAIAVGSVATILLLLAAIFIVRRRSKTSTQSLQPLRCTRFSGYNNNNQGKNMAADMTGQMMPQLSDVTYCTLETPPPPYLDNKVQANRPQHEKDSDSGCCTESYHYDNRCFHGDNLATRNKSSVTNAKQLEDDIAPFRNSTQRGSVWCDQRAPEGVLHQPVECHIEPDAGDYCPDVHCNYDRLYHTPIFDRKRRDRIDTPPEEKMPIEVVPRIYQIPRGQNTGNDESDASENDEEVRSYCMNSGKRTIENESVMQRTNQNPPYNRPSGGCVLEKEMCYNGAGNNNYAVGHYDDEMREIENMGEHMLNCYLETDLDQCAEGTTVMYPAPLDVCGSLV